MNRKRLALIIATIALLPAAGCGDLAQKGSELAGRAGETAARKLGDEVCKDTADDEPCMFDFLNDAELPKGGDGVDYPGEYPEYLKVDGFSPLQSSHLDDGTIIVFSTRPVTGDAVPLSTITTQAEAAGCTTTETTPRSDGGGSATMACADGRVSIHNAIGEGSPIQTLGVTISADG